MLVSARRFAELGVVSDGLETPPAANPQLSALSAPELIASAADQLVSLDGFDTSADRDAQALEAEAAGGSPDGRTGSAAGA
ncbi:hypothetical protein ACFP82_04880 [Cellulomonas gelida]|uniref:hypothetical protein n=1 Tax=Cellulomonas gelida TaxID=1712 RepID=UPI00361FCD94